MGLWPGAAPPIQTNDHSSVIPYRAWYCMAGSVWIQVVNTFRELVNTLLQTTSVLAGFT
jgi:hypothetical protein